MFGSTSSASHSSHWLLRRNLCRWCWYAPRTGCVCGWTRCVLTFALAPGILPPLLPPLLVVTEFLARGRFLIREFSAFHDLQIARRNPTWLFPRTICSLFRSPHMQIVHFNPIFINSCSTKIPIFEQILGSNFTAAINSSLHTFSNLHNLTERDIGERERERERKKDTGEDVWKNGCWLGRGTVVRALQLGGAYLSNVGLLTLGPWPAKSLSS